MTDLPPNAYRVAQRAFAEIGGGKANIAAFGLRRQNSVGTYFRLVNAPEGNGKRQTFEQSLAALRQTRCEVQE